MEKLNINSTVKIKLTPLGMEKVEENTILLPSKPTKNGYCTMPLWEVIRTFGKHLDMGSNPPFEPKITIVKKVV